jgi:hypothetical protein
MPLAFGWKSQREQSAILPASIRLFLFFEAAIARRMKDVR